MRILLVEDDRKLGKLLQYKLNKQHHQSDWAVDGDEAREKIDRNLPYDLYILDWMIPSGSGVELCGFIRGRQDKRLILMLTARDAVADRVEGLMAGADDYLVKPFSFDELFARIHALERRRESDWAGDVRRVADLTLNVRTLEVERGGVVVLLSKREFQLLTFLMTNAGLVLSREQILDRVWGMDADVTPNAVDASVMLLRKKIGDSRLPKLIQTVRGLGYRMVKS